MLIDDLSCLVTGRTSPLFSSDLTAHQKELREEIGGSRVLVIGGAGSIGSATVQAIVDFGPRSLHVIDQNENNLAELVRDLRSSEHGLSVPDFQALPLDFGSPVMHRFLHEMAPYDFILNFAALKHVRSEKDVFSLLQMLDTNVVKQAYFLRWLAETHDAVRYFCVSTDKAANPVNLMGASKRLLEHVIFSGEIISNSNIRLTSSRFANVAFSEGSLLDSFLKRLEKRQPFAVPDQTRRYFITLREAGQICLLALVCTPHSHILIPRLDQSRDLLDLKSVAIAVLRYHGFKPAIYDDETKARNSVKSDLEKGRYPLLITPLDTNGEKPYEEFVGEGEVRVEVGMTGLFGVEYLPAPPGTCLRVLSGLEKLMSDSGFSASKKEIVALVSKAVPQFRHIETGKNLDGRM